MSRRRGEFEHRTSIFEAAYRAWSYLGSLDPQVATNVDPVILESSIRAVCYEPLPRNGVSNPFILSILTHWLGEGAESKEIHSGLNILRTWWQHRRKGESATAKEALSPRRISSVVLAFTKYFFALAHRLVIIDKEEAPRSLRNKNLTMERTGQTSPLSSYNVASSANAAYVLPQLQNQQSSAGDLGLELNDRLTLTRELHAKSSGYNPSMRNLTNLQSFSVSLPHIPDSTATQMHTETDSKSHNSIVCTGISPLMESLQNVSQQADAKDLESFCASTSTPGDDHEEAPIVTMDSAGNYHFVVSIFGMVDGHCVKIVETVIRGTGVRSPIDGVLSVCARRTGDCGDGSDGAVLVRLEQSADPRDVGAACVQNLAMVGYRGEVIRMPFPRDIIDSCASAGSLAVAANVVTARAGESFSKGPITGLKLLIAALDVARENSQANSGFDWNLSCTCYKGVPEDNSACPKHSQLKDRIVDEFRIRKEIAKGLHQSQNNAICQKRCSKDGYECSTTHLSKTHEIPIDTNDANNDGTGGNNGERRSSWKHLLTLAESVDAGNGKRKKKLTLPLTEDYEAKRPRHAEASMASKSGNLLAPCVPEETILSDDDSTISSQIEGIFDDNLETELDCSEGIGDDLFAERHQTEEKLQNRKESYSL